MLGMYYSPINKHFTFFLKVTDLLGQDFFHGPTKQSLTGLMSNSIEEIIFGQGSNSQDEVYVSSIFSVTLLLYLVLYKRKFRGAMNIIYSPSDCK
jgi:hypothetical protein